METKTAVLNEEDEKFLNSLKRFTELKFIRASNGWTVVKSEDDDTRAFYFVKDGKSDLICKEEVA